MSKSKAIGLVRTSTDDQSISIEAQQESISKWCYDNDLEIIHIYIENGVSGSLPLDKRPVLMEALACLDAETVLVVAKRDRLAREAVEAGLAERIIKSKGSCLKVVSGIDVGEGATAELVNTILDAVAKYERVQIVLRTTVALRHKKSKGEKTGGSLPYGYSAEVQAGTKVLVDNPDEQAVVELIKQWHESGLSLRKVAGKLAERNILNRQGRQFQPQTIKNILTYQHPKE